MRNLRALPAPRVSRDQRHRVIPYRVHDGVELGGDREFALVFGEFNELCERSALMEIFVMCEHRTVLVDRRDRESFVSCDSFEFRLVRGEYRGVDLVPRSYLDGRFRECEPAVSEADASTRGLDDDGAAFARSLALKRAAFGTKSRSSRSSGHPRGYASRGVWNTRERAS